jgi:hypothetical protein
MDADDVGGGWILVTPSADTCAVDVPPISPEVPAPFPWVQAPFPWIFVGSIAGAAIIGAIVGYTMKGSKQ